MRGLMYFHNVTNVYTFTGFVNEFSSINASDVMRVMYDSAATTLLADIPETSRSRFRAQSPKFTACIHIPANDLRLSVDLKHVSSKSNKKIGHMFQMSLVVHLHNQVIQTIGGFVLPDNRCYERCKAGG